MNGSIGREIPRLEVASAWRRAGQRTAIPKTGTIVPIMGTWRKKAPGSGLAGALFTPVQQRVLGLLFGQPERSFGSGEIIRLAASGTGAVHRQLLRLEAAELVEVTRMGNQKHYRARRDSPIFAELHGLIVKTVGIVDPLRVALAPLADRIALAFIFGSVAKGSDTATSDLDLLVVSDELDYSEVYRAVERAERVMARPVNPTVMRPAEWRAAKAKKDSFVSRIAGQHRIFVLGNEGSDGSDGSEGA